MGASIVTSVDASPVLEFAEHVLDLVTLAVEGLVVQDGALRFVFDWIQAAMPRLARAARNQSAS